MTIQSPGIILTWRALAVCSVGLMTGGMNIAQAQSTPAPQWFEVPPSISLQTGDAWQQGEATLRLYGVQACLRGTTVLVDGNRRDCGDISMVYLAGLIRNSKPACMAVLQTRTPPQTLVICRARVGNDTIDLGLALVTAGFAFAAFKPDGTPVALEYVVAEELAKKDRAGLWRYPDLPHPIPALFGVLRQNAMPGGASTGVPLR